MKEKNLLNFDGMRFRAKIDGKEAIGIIRVERGKVFLCQNVMNGDSCCDRKGYVSSWGVGVGDAISLKANRVTDFFLCPNDPIDAVGVGDEFMAGSGNVYRVIARIGDAVITECKSMAHVYFINEMKNARFKPLRVQWLYESKPEPEIVEYTIEDIAKLTGVSPERIRIKK